MELPHFFVSRAHSGCNSRLSSIASNPTSLLSTARLAGWTATGWRSKCRSSHAPTAGRFARAAESLGRATIGSRRGVSSSCHCGRFRSFSSTLCGVSIVRSAASRSNVFPGPTASSNIPFATNGSWPIGPGDSPGKRSPRSFRPLGSTFTTPSITRCCGAFCTGICRASRRSASTRSNGSGVIIT